MCEIDQKEGSLVRGISSGVPVILYFTASDPQLDTDIFPFYVSSWQS